MHTLYETFLVASLEDSTIATTLNARLAQGQASSRVAQSDVLERIQL